MNRKFKINLYSNSKNKNTLCFKNLKFIFEIQLLKYQNLKIFSQKFFEYINFKKLIDKIFFAKCIFLIN